MDRLLGATLLAVALLVIPAPGHAQDLAAYDYEDLEFRGIGGEFGLVWPARVESTNYLGLLVDLGFIGPRVRVVPVARFWSSRLVQEEVDELAQQIILVCERQPDALCPEALDLGEIRLSDLEIAVDARYEVFPTRDFSPFLGGGLGVHLLNGRGDSVDGTFVEDLLDTVTPGLNAVAGLNVRLFSSLQLTVDGRFAVADDVRYASTGLSAAWTLPIPGPASGESPEVGLRP